jgi:hypothetical protein
MSECRIVAGRGSSTGTLLEHQWGPRPGLAGRLFSEESHVKHRDEVLGGFGTLRVCEVVMRLVATR